MLEFILGRCGNGKSKKIREIIIDKIKSGSEKIILIIPEQSSFENEKKMLELLGNQDFNKIHVLSFSRLFDFVSQALKIPPIPIAEDMTQIVMMNAAIENVKKDLKLYAKNSGDIETADLMLRTLKELKSNKIDDRDFDTLEKLSDKNILKQKIAEIKLIINSYRLITENKFADSFDNLNTLEKIIKKNNVFAGCSIFFDEFSDFTPQQLSIIEVILTQAKDVYMTFCCGKITPVEDKKDLFLCVMQTINKVKALAKKHNVKINSPLILSKTSRFRNLELEMLEKNIFSAEKISLNYIPKNIQIYNALDQNDECEYIAQNIKKLVIEKNYSYKDFAVLTRDMESYSGKFKSVFKKYDIPYFSDSPEKIFNKNLVNLIFASLDCVNSFFDTADILNYIKSGLIGLSTEDTAFIENYALMWNIRANGWTSDFTMHPEGFSKDFKEIHVSELEKLNELRQFIIKPLERFKKRVLKTTGEEISRSIYNLLIEVHAPENLRVFCGELLKIGEKNAAEQQTRLWDILMDILNEMSRAFENTKISPKKYADILSSVINCVNFLSIPQNIDNVVIGCANRVRLSDPKIVFLAGAVNGEFPKIPNTSEIFTELEINHISSLGIQFTDNIENFLIKERFSAYTAVASASQKLFISWPSSNTSNKGNLPSEIIKEVKAIFPPIKILNRNSFKFEESIWCAKPAFEACARNWQNTSKIATELKNYFIKNENYSKKCEAIENVFNKDLLNFKNPQNAREFFGENISLSASQIEKYYKCRFGYFCEYALKIKPQKSAQFGALEYGNLMHFVLEKIFKKYPRDKIIDTSPETLESEINTVVESYIASNLAGSENKPERFIYIIERFKKSINFLVGFFVEEFKQSSFVLTDLELDISKNGDILPLAFNLPNGGKITIEGKIDRVDVMSTENGNYIRIIDYKTGSKDFALADVFYGINTQMLIYLLAVQKNGAEKYGNVIPAGVLYFTALKPVIDAKSPKSTLKDYGRIKKEMQMKGIILDNITVVSGMEKEGQGVFIPAKIKNGEVKKSQSITNLAELEVISRHIERLVKEMAAGLQEGYVSAKPICKKNSTACKWCDYFPVCCYEEEKFVNIPVNVENREILDLMAQESEKNNG